MTELFLKTFEPISMSSQIDVSDTRTAPSTSAAGSTFKLQSFGKSKSEEGKRMAWRYCE